MGLKISNKNLIPFTNEMKNFLHILDKNKGDVSTSMSVANIDSDILNTWITSNKKFRSAYNKISGLLSEQVKFLKIFASKMGNIKQACASCNIPRATYYMWYNDELSSVFRNAVNDVLEGLKDDAESVLFKKVFVDNDTTSLIWYMKTKMRDRGYVERTEQEIEMSAKVSMNKYKSMSDDELDNRIEELEKKLNKGE